MIGLEITQKKVNIFFSLVQTLSQY